MGERERAALTEPMFYVLMSFLHRDMCGIEIAEFVERRTGGRLRLGPLVTTRSACPDLAAEGAFLQALNQAQRYRISNNILTLYAADTLGTPLARLQAVND